eukprot:TRINITY_DN7079_c0_g1_i1.p1 TRINITY_DN7079_c0_g1~~TRINITY_DN7079_c0_g1_i1.p1  ORF type:complete len:470 (+),score=112.07 TRINITY_DN7079_c0_g1_i1:47-1456(+)
MSPEKLAASVPIRLTSEERVLQKLLTSALDVSEYTNKVDGTGSYYRQKLIVENLYDLYQIMLGLNVNSSKDKGRKMLQKAYEDGSPAKQVMKKCDKWIASIFEIGRRYKRMNPDMMRSEYGKLISLMQDAVQYRNDLGMDICKPVKSVRDVLELHGLMDILRDEELAMASTPLSKMEPEELEAAGKQKEALIQALSQKHANGDREKADIAELCIRSLDDGNCFLKDNAASLGKMIDLLKQYFHPETGLSINEKYGDISIGRGGGSMLSHSHHSHYYYVLESLTLWKCIMSDIFNLWSVAEADMLDPSRQYRMRNTGQGTHRMKSAPLTGSAMRSHIAEAQRQMGGKWVGSQIVHLGDDDVPNALVFIDKYTQVPRIINPIIKVVEAIDTIAELPGQGAYLERKFGSPEDCKVAILQDFFRHAFDGSGDDGGSCIDGRLTSAWNWCSRLHKKPYYHTFLLGGFQGFDGQW